MSLTHVARQRISPAIVRRTGWAAAIATLAIVGVYLALVGRAVDRQRRADLRATAEIVAAALGEPDEQFVRQADHLLSRAGVLAAVGTTDAAGRLQMLLPDRPEYRQAAALTLASPGEAVASGVSSGANRGELWGVALPSNNRSGSGAPKSGLVLLFTPGPGAGLLPVSAVGFAALVLGVNLLAVWALCRWLDQRIIRPLQDLQTPSGGGRDRCEDRPGESATGWHELDTLAQTIHDLRRGLVESNGRQLRLQHAAEQRIKDHQCGLDRKLQRATALALTDPLTGLRNRTFLNERLEGIFVEQRESGDDLAVVMLDVDNFKRHNDLHGHVAGDDALRFIGHLLGSAVRPTDHAVRYGGDEFMLIVPGADAVQGAKIAERVIKLFSQYVGSLADGGGLALSAGAASRLRVGAASGRELLDAADRALYAAKRAGKNKVVVAASAAAAASS